jgi:hypothetical protein
MKPICYERAVKLYKPFKLFMHQPPDLHGGDNNLCSTHILDCEDKTVNMRGLCGVQSMVDKWCNHMENSKKAPHISNNSTSEYISKRITESQVFKRYLLTIAKK